MSRRMRLMWHSVSPWANTGYGRQTALWVPLLAALGYDIAISAFSGLQNGMMEWRGFPVYPGGVHPQGADMLAMNAGHFGADGVITLLDTWALGRQGGVEAVKGVPIACWTPLDAGPFAAPGYDAPERMPAVDKQVIEGIEAVPIAITRWGQSMMLEAGLKNALYVPHGVDANVFKPHPDRTGLRKAMGIDDRFVIGIFSSNMDGSRKGWVEQLKAFSRLARKHSDALLIMHTIPKQDGGIDLDSLAGDLCIPRSCLRASSQYEQSAGLIPDEDMAGTMSCCDLASQCAWAEGFGLPIIEAQLCGTPVVATKWSAMEETCGGWLVPVDPFDDSFYIPGHRGWWARPRASRIAKVYEQAYDKGPVYQAKKAGARDFGMRFAADDVLKTHWAPAMAELEAQWM